MPGAPSKRAAEESVGNLAKRRVTFEGGESAASAARADSIVCAPFFGAVSALYSDVLPTVPLLATQAVASRYGHASYIGTLRRFESAIPHFESTAVEPLVRAAQNNTCNSAPEFYTHLEKVWQGPKLPNALGFATFFFDAVHYGLKLSPQKVRLVQRALEKAACFSHRGRLESTH